MTTTTTSRTAATTRTTNTDRRTADGLLRDIAFVLEMTRRMRSESRAARPAAGSRAEMTVSAN